MKSEEEPFIRKVSLEKENLTIVLASENQLAELAKYSTSELDFSIVQLDPTFNLVPYECTPISYRNLLLKNKRSGTSPVRLWSRLDSLSKRREDLSRIPPDCR